MKIRLFSLLLLIGCFGLQASCAELLSGTWSGKLHIQGMSLGIVFHIGEPQGPDALPVVTMDSPDQGTKDIPANTDFCSADSLAVSVPALALTYTGKLKGETIEGTFTQMGKSLPLSLTRGKSVRVRPQTPQPPFPYKTEDVTFTSDEGKVTLAGTLTLPQNADANTPVVLMVSGSGLQDRDETLFGHKPFAVLADRLARAGIGSLRYNDRGVAPSTGDPSSATTYDFANDALSGLNYLKNKGFTHAGILGHSEGGMIAFMLSGYTDFIVTLGAPALPGYEILLDQLNTKFEELGLDEQERKRAGTVLSQVFATVISQNPELPVDSLTPFIKQNMAQNMELHSGPFFKEWNLLKAMSKDLSFVLNPWMMTFLALDPDMDITDAACPALALYGAKDTQVRPALNVDLMKELNPNIRIKVYDGLNHLMQPCATGKATEYGEIETTIDESVVTDIINFINAL